MANIDEPYRRIGANSWEELIDKVNEELQDPPDGCDPIDEIEIPEECHRWAKSDVREVHDKLDEMPEDCFEFEEIPDLWKISIIEDIEDQLGEAWCDCEDPCCYACPNCDTFSDIFLTTETVDASDCTDCASSPESIASCNTIRNGTYADAVADFSQRSSYSFFYSEWCVLLDELKILEDELEVLEEELEELEDQLTALQDVLANCGEDIGCVVATQAAIDTKNDEISDKNDEITEKEEEIEEKQMEADDKETQWMDAKTTSDGACARVGDALDQMVQCGDTTPFNLVASFSQPIPPQLVEACFDPQSAGPSGPTPFCCGRDWWQCRTRWTLRRRTYYTKRSSCNGIPLSLPDSGFLGTIGGDFDIDGAPCPTNPGTSNSCTFTHLRFFCFSTNCSSAPCGEPCGHPNNEYNYDWSLRLAPPGCISFQFDKNCEGEPCEEEEES